MLSLLRCTFALPPVPGGSDKQYERFGLFQRDSEVTPCYAAKALNNKAQPALVRRSMSMQQGRSQEREEMMEATERTGMSPALWGAVASVLLSWYYFFGRGKREMGVFVGLWPPTILAFASYFRQEQMLAKMNDMGMGGIQSTVREIMGRNR